jgi:tRNA(Ile)-lysidine synthase
MTPDEDGRLLRLATRRLDGPDAPRRIGLAVSGGGDSMAMLRLLAPWARERGIAVFAATVDHGLRPEAAAEARFVAKACRDLGVPHDTLEWRGWNGRGNLQAAAREARQRLLGDWARGLEAEAVLLGHTRDDQAETVLLRLTRGSGVDGLSGMAGERVEGGLRWMRPLLEIRRGDLRDYLRRQGQAWVEDPSNGDPRYDRVRARRALEALGPLGIDAEGLAATARRMAAAREALECYAVREAERLVELRRGDVLIDREGLLDLPGEMRLRLVAAALRWVSGSPYRPRREALEAALAEAAEGRTRSLGGALIRSRRGRVEIGREPRAVVGTVAATDALWDGRWRLSGVHAPGLEVRSLGGEGIALCPGWRDAGLARSSVLASPAVWQGETLVAAPLAGRAEGWVAEVVTDYREVLRGRG